LAAALIPGDVVAVEGELGTGKTVLIQGIAQGLGVTAAVHSPTFVLHHRYHGRVQVDHFDLFRLGTFDWMDSGLDDAAPDAVTLIEWPERATPLKDWCTVRLRLEARDDGRTITMLRGTDPVRACFYLAARARRRQGGR